MSFGDLKISEAAIQSTGVQSQPDTLTGSAPDNKLVFDALPTLIIQKLNSLLDLLGGSDAANEMPIEPIDGMTATTVQQALAELRQALTAYINLMKGTTGAAQVGVSAISGVQAENVQQALVALKSAIDVIVAGTLPEGSVTAELIENGAVTAEKLGENVTGDVISVSATDKTPISSSLSNKMVNYGVLSNVDVLDWALSQTVSGTFLTTPTVTGVSEQSYYHGVLSVTGSERGLMLWHLDGKLQTRNTISGGWSGSDWVPYTTAMPPQVYNLPLASQIPSSQSYTNCYYKTQDNIVHVSFRIAHNDKFQKSEVFATLPVGYRPGYTIARCVAGDGIIDYGSGIVVAEIQIYRDGNIMLFHCNSDVKWLLGEFSFVAED